MLRYLSSGVSSYLSGRDGNPSSSTQDAPPTFKEPRRSANAADDDDDDEPPAFPLPGSIQRAGSSKTADKGDVGDNGAREEQHGEGADDDDDDDDDSDSESDDQGDHHQPINIPLDFQVSPPSPTQTNDSRASTPKAAHYAASPSTTVPPPVAYQRARPKPSHRPFPPEPEFLLAGRNSCSSSSSSTSPSNGARQGAYGLALPPSTTAMPPKRGKKVALKPGHSALDWARFSREEGEYLKCGMSGFERIPMSEVAEHRRRDDAWSVFHGKVYNITPYLNYHPGGVPELMRVAGRDGTELFMKTHGWVNAELMLESCLLGMLVKEAQE